VYIPVSFWYPFSKSGYELGTCAEADQRRLFIIKLKDADNPAQKTAGSRPGEMAARR
jgi:hypothetical protein